MCDEKEDDALSFSSTGEVKKENKFTYLFKPKILSNFNTALYFDEADIKKVKEKNDKGENVKLMLTDKGVYSISKPIDANWIMDCVKRSIENGTKIGDMVITDSTAGLGGNTISFAKKFKAVNGVEINDIHFFVLRNNIEVLDLGNVNLVKDNYLNQLDKLKEDVVFIDPPWGGKKYHYIKYFNIRLGKIPIAKVINRLHDKGTKYVVLKCPYNTNVTDILRNSEYDNCNVFKSSNIWLLVFY